MSAQGWQFHRMAHSMHPENHINCIGVFGWFGVAQSGVNELFVSCSLELVILLTSIPTVLLGCTLEFIFKHKEIVL